MGRHREPCHHCLCVMAVVGACMHSASMAISRAGGSSSSSRLPIALIEAACGPFCPLFDSTLAMTRSTVFCAAGGEVGSARRRPAAKCFIPSGAIHAARRRSCRPALSRRMSISSPLGASSRGKCLATISRHRRHRGIGKCARQSQLYGDSRAGRRACRAARASPSIAEA